MENVELPMLMDSENLGNLIKASKCSNIDHFDGHSEKSKTKNHDFFAYFPWWANGPYSPGLGSAIPGQCGKGHLREVSSNPSWLVFKVYIFWLARLLARNNHDDPGLPPRSGELHYVEAWTTVVYHFQCLQHLLVTRDVIWHPFRNLTWKKYALLATVQIIRYI